jgi:hypothetical protein
VVNGGTGASDAPTARTNLGAAPLASPTFTGTVTIPGELAKGSTKITGLADGTAAADAVNKGQLDPVRTGARTGGEQITGNKTIATADLGKTFIANSSSQITFTFPPGVEAAMGDTITILRWGTGEVVLAKSVSGSLASPGNRLRLTSQYSACTVTFFTDTGSNTEFWIVSGDMKV